MLQKSQYLRLTFHKLGHTEHHIVRTAMSALRLYARALCVSEEPVVISLLSDIILNSLFYLFFETHRNVGFESENLSSRPEIEHLKDTKYFLSSWICI